MNEEITLEEDLMNKDLEIEKGLIEKEVNNILAEFSGLYNRLNINYLKFQIIEKVLKLEEKSELAHLRFILNI